VTLWLVSLRLALGSLNRARLRSALTTLGILIGIASVVVVVAIGRGAREQVGDSIGSLGSNVIYVFSRPVAKSGARSDASAMGVSVDDAAAIGQEAGSIDAVTVYSSATRQVVTAYANASTSVVGADRNYLSVRGYSLTAGRNFTESEETHGARVALIGATAQQKLFGSDDPVGQTLRIGKHPYRVVGLLSPKGASPFGDDQDDRIVMPVSSWRSRISPETGRRVHMIMGSAKTAAHAEQAKAQVEAILRQRHRIAEGEEADFRVASQDEFRQTQEGIVRILSLLLVSVAAVSLFVGGVGVMNIMLVNVTERQQEIGIRMAIGAKRRDIEIQFLVEALVLSILGGAAGLVLAIGIIVAIQRGLGWAMSLSWDAIAAAILTSLIVGFVFGFLPARRAAMLEPMEALRHE
jgi:putative ABC transport system permease protein